MSGAILIRLCGASEIAEGSVKRFEVEGHAPIAVYRIGGRLHATADRCTHAEASLSEGIIDGDLIECPFHGGTFDIRTGEAVGLPCVVPLESYRVLVDGGDLYVDLEKR